MKTYTLTIVYDEDEATIEYIEEEITEDVPSVMYKIDGDPDYYDDETLKQLIKDGLIAES